VLEAVPAVLTMKSINELKYVSWLRLEAEDKEMKEAGLEEQAHKQKR
jgi:hypothetical protein